MKAILMKITEVLEIINDLLSEDDSLWDESLGESIDELNELLKSQN